MPYDVVVVDDAADLRKLIVRAFARDGRLAVVADVGDGRQGIDAVHEHRPHAVLMDVSMPVMDGLTATRELKQTFPDLPIVVFTGYGDERVAAEATASGADGFVSKSEPLSAVADLLVELASQA